MADMDLAKVVYWYQGIIHFLGAVLFTTNWIRMKRASTIYIYITLIFWAGAWDYGMSAYVRGLQDNHEAYHAFHNSGLWHTRSIPLAIFLTIFVGHMAWRFFIRKRNA